MAVALYKLTEELLDIQRRMEEENLPAEVIADTLEGLQLPVEDKARQVACFIRNIEAEADAIEAYAKKINEKLKTAKSRVQSMKDYLRTNMAACGITEIASNDGTFKVKLYRKRDELVVIDDETALPASMMRIVPAKKEPDKIAIKTAINGGQVVSGAHIEKRDRLEIK